MTNTTREATIEEAVNALLSIIGVKCSLSEVNLARGIIDRAVESGRADLKAEVERLTEALEEITRIERDEKPDGTVLGALVHDAEEMAAIAVDALAPKPGPCGPTS